MRSEASEQKVQGEIRLHWVCLWSASVPERLMSRESSEDLRHNWGLSVSFPLNFHHPHLQARKPKRREVNDLPGVTMNQNRFQLPSSCSVTTTPAH